MARLVSYFLLLSLIPLTITGTLAYDRSRQALERETRDHLSTTATLKEEEINRWIEEKKRDTRVLAQTPIVRQQARMLLTQDETSAGYRRAHGKLADYLMVTVLVEKPDLQEVFILSYVGGKVVFSTNGRHEGNYEVTSTFFTEGRERTYVQNVYPSAVLGKPAMTIATPLEDDDAHPLGVLAVHLNLDKMGDIMLERGGLGATGETYLVDKFNVFVSKARFGEEDFPRGVHTQGIDAAVQDHQDGVRLYRNYRDVPVIGAYRWMDDREMALLAEVEQREAFRPARTLALMILGVAVLSAVIVMGGAYVVGSQIAEPVVAVTETATRMAGGELNLTVPVTTEDEIGALATAFNTMAGELARSHAELEQKVEVRTWELAQRNKELQEAYEEQARLLETIRQLSSPVIPVFEGILVLPLVGVVDTQRARQMMDNVLRGVEERGAHTVIIDITGVPTVDTGVANHLLQTVSAARLLGAQCILVGLRPEVAGTIVELGVDLSGIVTRSDLQGGIEYALRTSRK